MSTRTVAESEVPPEVCPQPPRWQRTEPFFPFFAVPMFGPNPDDQAVSMAFVREGLCPICGAGPFAVVATHVRWKHGIDRFGLRDMLGVYKNASICDEGHSAQASRRAKRQWHKVEAKMREARPKGRGTRTLSPAGIERNRRQAAANRNVAMAALRKAGEDRKAEAMVRYEAMRSRWDAGLSLGEIAAQFGVRPKTVREGLTALGVEIGNDALRRRASNPENLRRARAAHLANTAKRRQQRVDRFFALGGDWASLETLAREEGLPKTEMKQALKRSGATVPDGRSATLAHRLFTDEQETEIRRRYEAGGISQSELAAEYGTTQSTISSVVRRGVRRAE